MGVGLDYLDFGGALKSGFDLGLRVQDMRLQKRMAAEAQANRGIELELQRQQEKRQREELQEAIRARRALAMEQAQRQMDSAGYILEANEAVRQGKTPLEAHVNAVAKYPKAHQAQNSILGLFEKQQTTPEDISLQFNAQGVPFYRNAEGKLEIPPNSDDIRKDYLKDQKAIALETKKLNDLKSLQAKGETKVKTGWFGGRPIQEAIDEAQGKLDEMMSKYEPKRPQAPAEHRATRGLLLERDVVNDPSPPEHRPTRGVLLEQERMMETPGAAVEETTVVEAPKPSASKKKLTKEQAVEFLRRAKGDKAKARQLAKDQGFDF